MSCLMKMQHGSYSYVSYAFLACLCIGNVVWRVLFHLQDVSWNTIWSLLLIHEIDFHISLPLHASSVSYVWVSYKKMTGRMKMQHGSYHNRSHAFFPLLYHLNVIQAICIICKMPHENVTTSLLSIHEINTSSSCFTSVIELLICKLKKYLMEVKIFHCWSFVRCFLLPKFNFKFSMTAKHVRN